ELPEVETTRRGLRPYALRRRIVALEVYEPRLRWPVPRDLPAKVAGQRIVRTGRRAKYLLLELESGTLLLHLGMSGKVRAVLAQAIRAGGTTLRDYLGADGAPGYFRQRLYVYERRGRPCRRCGTPVRAVSQGQRSTYYCPSCQK